MRRWLVALLAALRLGKEVVVLMMMTTWLLTPRSSGASRWRWRS
jgi:hypothetical protein